jgi:hypothetical protein
MPFETGQQRGDLIGLLLHLLAVGQQIGALLLQQTQLSFELGDLPFRFGDQALLGTGAAVGGDQGFPHVAVEVAQIGEVDQLVHQRKAPGSGHVDLGGRLAGGCGCRHGRACQDRQRGKGRALAGWCSCERQRRQRLLTEGSAERQTVVSNDNAPGLAGRSRYPIRDLNCIDRG